MQLPVHSSLKTSTTNAEKIISSNFREGVTYFELMNKLETGFRAKEELEEIFRDENEFELERNHARAFLSRKGFSPADFRAAISETSDERISAQRNFLGRLSKVSDSSLEEADRTSKVLMERKLKKSVASDEMGFRFLSSNQKNGVQNSSDIAFLLDFREKGKFEDWLSFLETVPAIVEREVQNLREGSEHGITHPLPVVERILSQVKRQTVLNPADSPFFAPFLSKNCPEVLRKRAFSVVQKELVPAFVRFLSFLEREYKSTCRKSIGLFGLPNGKRMYECAVEFHLGERIEPEALHELGLLELEQNLREFSELGQRMGFSGTKSFFEALQTDPFFSSKILAR